MEYLYAVQDDGGREICAAVIDTDRVSDVTAVQTDDGTVAILLTGDEVVTGRVPDGKQVMLYRWPADDKLSEPQSHRVDQIVKSTAKVTPKRTRKAPAKKAASKASTTKN